MHKSIAMALLLAAGCSGGESDEAAPAAQRQPGQWETTSTITQIQVIGEPPEIQEAHADMVGRTTKIIECWTPEQARAPLAAMRKPLPGNCTVSGVYSNGTIRIRGNCPTLAEWTSEGTFTETTMQSTRTETGRGLGAIRVPEMVNRRITTEFASRRVGECTGDEPRIISTSPSGAP